MHPLPSLISNPSRLNATGFRVDHNLTRNITLFARYNHAPSYDGTRNWQQLWSTNSNVDTFTAGATFMLSPTKVNDFRANWSRNAASEIISLTNFYGAVVPPISVSFPPGTPYVAGTSRAIVTFPDGFDQGVQQGPLAGQCPDATEFSGTFPWAVGTHQLKFGVDYRRTSPSVGNSDVYVASSFAFTSVEAGSADLAFIIARDHLSTALNNYSRFAQDTWKATRKLTLIYGLRWEIDTPLASTSSGQPLYTRREFSTRNRSRWCRDLSGIRNSTISVPAWAPPTRSLPKPC